MFKEEYQACAAAASAKVGLLKRNFIGYVVLSMLAGMYVGFGSLLSFTIGGLFEGYAPAKVIMGLAFGIALALVCVAGGELFTGNNLVAAVGMIRKTITVGEGVRLWVVCYLGNLAGSILLAIVYRLTGLGTGAVAEFMAASAAAKMGAGPSELFFRGILCNVLVCLAIWCTYRLKSESARLIMTFGCILAFMTPGFEHCIANMTLMAVALLNPAGQAVSLGGYVYNLLFVTLGNMTGGVLVVAGAYALVSRD